MKFTVCGTVHLCDDAGVFAPCYLKLGLASPEPCILRRSLRDDLYQTPGPVLQWTLWDARPLEEAILDYQAGRGVVRRRE